MWDLHTHTHAQKGGAVRGRGVFTCVMLNCMAMLIGGHKTLGQLRTAAEVEPRDKERVREREHTDYPYLNIN